MCLLLVSSLVLADALNAFSIGEKTIHIPAPDGYTLVSSDMVAINAMNESLQDTLNDLVATYIQNEETGTALAGVLPEMKRSYSVKVNKELKNEHFAESDFLEMQDIIEQQNAGTFEQIEYEINRINEQDGLESDDLDINNALQISKIIPLEVHSKNPHDFAHSMYINYGPEADSTEDNVVAATLSYVNIKGTVLFMYAFAPQHELDWTQDSSSQWINSTLAANQIATNPAAKKLWQKSSILLSGLLLLCMLIGLLFVSKRKTESGNK